MHRKQANELSYDASLLSTVEWCQEFGLEGFDGGILMKWKDKEVDKFQVKRNENPKSGCPIIFCTPAIDYGLTVEDFKKIRQRIMEFEI